MTSSPSLDNVPRGATARGVNRAVIEYLVGREKPNAQFSMLDIPCGQGDFLSALRQFFPAADTRGCDLAVPEDSEPGRFQAVDASRVFRVFEGRQFDYVVSISGVMEFDNTLQFFESCHAQLRDSGQLVVTNDSLLTLRDRMEYLLFGKFRQYSAFMVSGEPTWKILPLQNLLRILDIAGFKTLQVSYVSMKSKDWMWLPLAVLIYPCQWLYVRLKRSEMPLDKRFQMHPFKSLFYRHYLVTCEKK